MQLSLRQKLSIIVGVTTFSFLLSIGVSWLLSAKMNKRAYHAAYIPNTIINYNDT